jgi:hypothetical protein
MLSHEAHRMSSYGPRHIAQCDEVRTVARCRQLAELGDAADEQVFRSS